MSQIQLIQGSQQWHDFRRVHIGSSDAPIIMGVSPYKTVKELLKEKLTGISETKEHAGMKRGRELEPLVLELLNSRYSCDMTPAVFEHDEYKFISASLDGYDPVSNYLCEIKCPNKLDHHKAELGEVPTKYYPQLQHALLVTGLPEIIYASYYSFSVVTVHVQRDPAYIENLLNQCQLFHKSMIDGQLDDQFDISVDRPDIDYLFQSYLDLKEKIKHYETQLESVKQRLVEAADHQPVTTQLVKIKEAKRTSYDYQKLCDDFKIDKEPYKKITSYWDIRERKNEN